MSAVAQVPVTSTPEVHAYVAELRMQAEFDQMLEHIRQTVHHLRAVHIYIDGPWDDLDVPCVIFDAHLGRTDAMFDGTHERWGEWFMSTFPPSAIGRFQLLFTPPGPDNAG
jgi:hypothetical protein